jgi:hypothetical protein
MQSLRAGKDLRSLRPQLEQVSDAGRKQTTSLEGFTSKLQEYGRSHQDFMPIILKYGLTNSGPAALGSKK